MREHRPCGHCRHSIGSETGVGLVCTIDLINDDFDPCESWEREPGSDDDLPATPQPKETPCQT